MKLLRNCVVFLELSFGWVFVADLGCEEDINAKSSEIEGVENKGSSNMELVDLVSDFLNMSEEA